MSSRRLIVSILAALCSVVSLAASAALDPAEAQYFGRNKVQFETLDFAVIETEHFNIYYHEGEQDAALQAARMAERWYARLSRILDHELRGKQPIILYADHPTFEQTNAIPGQIGESTGGVTEFLKRRIVLPLAGPMKESDHVIGHELVHAFQFDITGLGPNSISLAAPAALRMPLWFIEGMAEYLSIGSEDPFTAQWLRGAVKSEALPGLRELSSPRFFPYRYGHAFWAYIGGRFGDQAVGEMLKAAAGAGSIPQAMVEVLGVDPDSLMQDWHTALRSHYTPILELTQPPEAFARELVSRRTGSGSLNMGPALSPDGSEMIFVSEKGLFSVELFLADAETGEVKRKITETALDPHFQSLQYLSSAGAWSPDGERFALAAVVKGDPVLTVLNPRNGNKLQEVKLPDLGEIFNPTWSPDGRRVVFSAQVGGWMDLFVVDLETEELRRLTNDAYAELHPDWAPAGNRVVFATDRFTTRLETLRPGQFRLATIDVESGEVRQLDGFEKGKHINPQWAPDGESVHFISDQNGGSNLYRLEVASGRLSQLSNLQTAVSGITALSPALTVAQESGAVVFSVHGKGNFVFDLYRVDAEETGKLAGRPVRPDGTPAPAGDEREGILDRGAAGEGAERGDAPAAAVDTLDRIGAARLPPADREGGRVDALLADATIGLADAITFERQDYDPSLSLDFIGRPTLAIGADRFGFNFGAGGSAFFSDMLGNRNLSTLLLVDGSQGKVHLSSALFAGFANRSKRFNWGVQGGQIPFISRQFALTTRDTEFGPAFVFQDLRFWQVNREISGVIEYPFSSAQRLEFTLGAENVDFASNVREIVFTQDGRRISEDTRDFTPLDTLSSLNQAIGGAALVWDNAIHGATAPMAGQRYRFGVTPTVGDLAYYTVNLDYRKYFMPKRPFTLAFRGLHRGRYGGDADDFRLNDFFIGFPSLVRGYDFNSFDFDECPEVAGSVGSVDDRFGTGDSCPVFDQLLGSRYAVGNAEARLPLLGGVGLVPSANVPPIDLIGFFDAGIAWEGEDGNELADRDFVKSVGVGGRINLFGFVVFEVVGVNPLDRPEKGWHADFSVKSGF